MTLPDKPSESGTERDGILSYAAEWHAMTRGLYDGMKNWQVRPVEYPDDEDIQKEKHYYAGGYVIGTVLQGAIVVGAAAVGMGAL